MPIPVTPLLLLVLLSDELERRITVLKYRLLLGRRHFYQRNATSPTMVKIAAVQQRNALYAKEQHESGLVCVFHGATSGIGASTLEQLADILHEPTFYVLGRSASRFARQRAAIESINPGCKVNFIEIDVSLLANIDNACQQIAAVEKKVDCLYMSAGLIPLNGAQCRCHHLFPYFCSSSCLPCSSLASGDARR